MRPARGRPGGGRPDRYLWESAEGPDDGEEDYHAALSQALAALLEFERLAGELETELDVRRRA